MAKKTAAERLHIIRIGVLGVLNSPEIQEKLAALGYTYERMAEGMRMLESAEQVVAMNIEYYSDQYTSTSELRTKWAAAYSVYMITLKVVRVAFKGQVDKLARFRANGERNRSLSGWLNDANIFYTNLLNSPEAIEKMFSYGYSVDRLQKEQQAVSEVEKLHSMQLSEKGKAQQSTVERDKVIDQITNWYSDFRAIARIALYDKPQLLEALGIIKK
jgi:hypothetical protein